MEFLKFIVAVCQREILGSSSIKHKFIDHVDIKFTTKTAFRVVNIFKRIKYAACLVIPYLLNPSHRIALMATIKFEVKI